MKSARAISRNRILVVALAILVAFPIVAWAVIRSKEKSRYAEFSEYLSDNAEQQYKSKSLLARAKIAKATERSIEKVKGTDWGLEIAELRERSDTHPEFLYALDTGTARLADCSIYEADVSPAGRCGRFSHEQDNESAGGTEFRFKEIPLSLYLDDSDGVPHAQSDRISHFAVGPSDQVKTSGLVRLDSNDISVSQGSLYLPDPTEGDTKRHEVEIRDFSLLHTPILEATKNWDFDVSYDMPPLLASLFDNDERLTALRLDGAVSVDLREDPLGYKIAGRVIILNTEVGEGAADWYPDNYASISLKHLKIPTIIPQLCFNVEDSLIELDFNEKSLRVGGSMVLESARSFRCTILGGSDMNFASKVIVSGIFDAARRRFHLPDRAHLRSHMVVDLDSKTVCGDLDFQGSSIFHAAYLGQSEELVFWAPKMFTSQDISFSRFFSGALVVGRDFANANWSFPKTMPWQCWNGDRGPRTELFESILPEWGSVAGGSGEVLAQARP